jgi:hypothetical protein
VRLKLADLHQARAVASSWPQPEGDGLLMRDWTQQNRTWFAAVQLEKRMMFIILTLIVAVAAFNLVSTLVMTVTDKRADIAILRTLGASPRSIMGIFMVQGAMVGVIGTLAGLAAGPGHCLQHRRDRAGHRAAAATPASCPRTSTSSAACPASRRQRHRADCADLAGAGLCGHAVPELARQPREPGRGAAL